MPIDWNDPDLIFLKKQLATGHAVLFTGAGFSVDGTNQLNEPPPLGAKLSELLADSAGFPFSGESLPIVYEAVQKQIGSHKLWADLRKYYDIRSYADWYNVVKALTWYRIYTLNIDNLFQKIYFNNKGGQYLQTIINPSPHEERDSLFSDLQCICLHGHVEHPEKGLSFTLSDFGNLTATPNPWYRSFVEDLYFRTVVFIGTQLEEPMFFHYLHARGEKERGFAEFRPKSYLVNRTIGAMRINNLRDRNIVGIECTAKEFFESLAASVDVNTLSLASVRHTAFPHVIIRNDKAVVDTKINRHFDYVQPDILPYTRKPPAEGFFMGAEPDWFDIAEERDAFRGITQEVIDNLPTGRESFSLVVLHGPAGSGKTTTLMRAAERVAANGGLVYYAKGNERLDLTGILEFANEPDNKKKRIFIFIDVFTRQLTALDYVRESLKKSANVTLVLADRTNKFAQVSHALSDMGMIELRMPDLTANDVGAIIAKLKQFGFLGELRNKTPEQQTAAFMERAEKQLLVALREATSGKGFDLILRNEFNELAKPAQLAYTICCIAVAHGATGVYLRHLLPCLGRTEFRQAAVIKDLLRGVLVPTNQSESMVKPRHRLIAYWVATEIAPVGLKVEAVSKFLAQISPDIIPNEIKRRSPAYVAYRGIINSEAMKETFSNDAEIILELYDELKELYDRDFLFWLQYAMAQINAGNLDVAENYLNQSLAINPASHQTKHHLGCLYLMQATANANPAVAQDRAAKGIELLTEQIRTKGDENSYPYHAYLIHVCRWYQRATTLIPQRDWEKLRAIGTEAQRKYQRDEMIPSAVRDVERHYLLRVAIDVP